MSSERRTQVVGTTGTPAASSSWWCTLSKSHSTTGRGFRRWETAATWRAQARYSPARSTLSHVLLMTTSEYAAQSTPGSSHATNSDRVPNDPQRALKRAGVGVGVQVGGRTLAGPAAAGQGHILAFHGIQFGCPGLRRAIGFRDCNGPGGAAYSATCRSPRAVDDVASSLRHTCTR